MTAPAPSPYEQSEIDRFGIFAEERVVEEVARAIADEDLPDFPFAALGSDELARYRRLAAAAVAAVRAAQDGGAEEAVRRETVVMCTHGSQGEHPWKPGEGCPDALAAGTWSVR